MALRETFQVVIDVTTEGAQKSLKRLKSDVAQAEGAMGKARVAASGLGGALQQYAGQMAITAGVAIAAFGVKSVKAFTDGALAAGRFADATGVSVEAASRLVEVAGDLGIESDSVQSALLRMNVAIAKNTPALKGMADEIVRAKDGSVDSAASFENLVTRIGAIPDATERARVAQEVFGRGYAGIARLMELSAQDLRAELEGVADAQVFTDAERREAERYERAINDLEDAVGRLSDGFAQSLAPSITTAANALTWLIEKAQDLSENDKTRGMFMGWGDAAELWATQADKVFGTNMSGKFDDTAEAVTTLDEALGMVESRVDATDYERIDRELTIVKGSFEDAEAAAEAAKLEAERLEQQWQDLFDSIDADRAVLNLEQQFDDLKKSQTEAFYAGVAGAEDAEDKQRDYQLSLVDTRDEVARYAKEVLGLPLERVTEILADLDAGEVDKVERQLDTLTRYREARIRPVILPDRIDRTEPPRLIPVDGQRANGGPMRAGGTYLVGERGPELVVPNRASTVIPNHRLGAAAAAPMVVNITTGADPEEVVRAIERYRRRNGSLPF
jgi:hypothetical protein